MRYSQLYFKNNTSTWYRAFLILYSLYPISDLCSFSKFITCCITCRRNGTGSFLLIPPGVSFLNSKVNLYPAAPRGPVSSSLYEILLGICIPAHAIAISVFMLDAVMLSLPHCSLSLWKHFISMSLVHVAPGAVRFYTLCNILSPRPFDAPFPFSLPHLCLPFILRTPFPSCHRCAFHTPPTSCRLNCSPPNTASGIGIPLPTFTQVANSVHKA